jgi:hypothetical protein
MIERFEVTKYAMQGLFVGGFGKQRALLVESQASPRLGGLDDYQLSVRPRPQRSRLDGAALQRAAMPRQSIRPQRRLIAWGVSYATL